MTKWEKLLQDKEIAELLNTHQGANREIRKAAEILAEKDDAKTALLKLKDALSEKTISVFFSYKKKDEDTAKSIVTLLRKRSAGKLNITYQREFTEEIVGKKWRNKIQEAVGKANWFILLLPDPRDEWDWCLYETGLFEAKLTSADSLICLHHPKTKIPSPIEGYQAVAANIDEVDKFLRWVFLADNPVPGLAPLNIDIESDIPEMAREIVKAIRTPKNVVREYYEPWIELQIDNPKTLKDIDELDQAHVKAANQKALELFRLLKRKPVWGEFRSNLATTDTDNEHWLEDLCQVIRKISNDLQFYPIHSVFQTAEGKMYQPVVCAVDRDGDIGDIDTFHLTFAESVASVDRSAMPKEVSVLANFLRSTFRFRWEVLEKYGKGPMTKEDVEGLQIAMRRIRQDWESRNIGGAEICKSLFPGKEQRLRIAEMQAIWDEVKNDDESGSLDISIEKKDTEQISKILRSFLPINTEFLKMLAERFAELATG